MTAQTNRKPASKKKRSFWNRLARRAAVLIAGILLLPFVLTVFYAFVAPPVSTLMVWRWAAGAPIDYRWRDIEDIAPILPATLIMTEDARFCSHYGVDWQALRKVFRAAENGTPSRGASTISMQTVKNVFLWPSRSYVRKAIEFPLAHFADLIWGKQRTMEIYLNVVEWGPGVYGAEAAAQAHFNRPASKLTRTQAARLAAVLPNPLARSAANPSRAVRRLSHRALSEGRNAAPWITCLEDD